MTQFTASHDIEKKRKPGRESFPNAMLDASLSACMYAHESPAQPRPTSSNIDTRSPPTRNFHHPMYLTQKKEKKKAKSEKSAV